jgi:predicted nucleic acid-binding protein
MFIACALEAKADFIIFRNKHLGNLKDFQGIKIIDLTTFLETIKRQKE